MKTLKKIWNGTKRCWTCDNTHLCRHRNLKWKDDTENGQNKKHINGARVFRVTTNTTTHSAMQNKCKNQEFQRKRQREIGDNILKLLGCIKIVGVAFVKILKLVLFWGEGVHPSPVAFIISLVVVTLKAHVVAQDITRALMRQSRRTSSIFNRIEIWIWIKKGPKIHIFLLQSFDGWKSFRWKIMKRETKDLNFFFKMKWSKKKKCEVLSSIHHSQQKPHLVVSCSYKAIRYAAL